MTSVWASGSFPNMELHAAERMACQLMAEHGLTTWRFKFDHAKRRFGYCRWHCRTIGLSRYLVRLNDEARVRRTILHEIAHALAGAKAGHGPAWRRQAAALGIEPRRCYSAADTVTVPAPWRGECHTCFHTFPAFRRRHVACGRCCRTHNGGRFDPRYLILYTPNTQSDTVAP